MATSQNNGKSLSESINDVMNSSKSMSAKRADLIKLGLTKADIWRLFEIHQTRPTIGDFDFSKLTFGIEIEAYNFTRDSLIREGRANGVAVRSEHYNHDDGHAYYKMVYDSSIRGENSNEVVSPILKGRNGLDSLKALCNALNSIGAKVNRSCGLHVHIGAANMTDEHFCRLVRNYQNIELAIDSFMPQSRKGNNNEYCMSLRGINIGDVTTKSGMIARLGTRYRKVNAEAYMRHKTIEFRQHSGTTEYEKIAHWVMFLAKLVEYSYKYECPVCFTIEELPFLTASEKQYFTNRRNALA